MTGRPAAAASGRPEPEYAVAHVVTALACDEEIHLLGVGVVAHGSRLELRGELSSEALRPRVLAVAAAAAPGWEVLDDLVVRGAASRGVGREEL